MLSAARPSIMVRTADALLLFLLAFLARFALGVLIANFFSFFFPSVKKQFPTVWPGPLVLLLLNADCGQD